MLPTSATRCQLKPNDVREKDVAVSRGDAERQHVRAGLELGAGHLQLKALLGRHQHLDLRACGPLADLHGHAIELDVDVAF